MSSPDNRDGFWSLNSGPFFFTLNHIVKMIKSNKILSRYNASVIRHKFNNKEASALALSHEFNCSLKSVYACVNNDTYFDPWYTVPRRDFDIETALELRERNISYAEIGRRCTMSGLPYSYDAVRNKLIAARKDKNRTVKPTRPTRPNKNKQIPKTRTKRGKR